MRTSLVMVPAIGFLLAAGCDDDPASSRFGPLPAAVADLRGTSTTDSSVTLLWSAPERNGSLSSDIVYEIRYSVLSGTMGNWWDSPAVAAETLTTAWSVGETESHTVTGLRSDTSYLFALRSAGAWAADGLPVWSEISSAVSTKTKEPARGTILRLITHHFPIVYSSRDSAGYEEMLDEEYEFRLLASDIEGETDPDHWDKAEELVIAGRMFHGWENPAGGRVLSISLSMILKSTVEDTTDYPEKPAAETWFLAVASIDLTFVVKGVGADGFTNYMVSSDQHFVCRPDPDDPDLWTIFRQVDQEPIDKVHDRAGVGGRSRSSFSDPGTEQATWGFVKSRFR